MAVEATAPSAMTGEQVGAVGAVTVGGRAVAMAVAVVGTRAVALATAVAVRVVEPQAVHPAVAAQMGTPRPLCSSGTHHSRQSRGHTRTDQTGSLLGSTLRQHRNRGMDLLRCTRSSTTQTRGGSRDEGAERWVGAAMEAV